MACFICVACGTQYAESAAPPSSCGICTDDRQYVPWSGPSWTTPGELTESHAVRFEPDGGLMGIGVTPSFAIPQRALLVPTRAGNVMWDCTSVVTDNAIDTLAALGGIVAIAISHPHFYSSMVEWSDALGGVPVFVHADDREWIVRPSPNITPWGGDRYDSLRTPH
jgi:glyoxylase-like metal-dependent hydrolase (beta-lactamase superfamily II)